MVFRANRKVMRKIPGVPNYTLPSKVILEQVIYELILKGKELVCQRVKRVNVSASLCLDGEVTFPKNSCLLADSNDSPPHIQPLGPALSIAVMDGSLQADRLLYQVCQTPLPHCLRVLPNYVQVTARCSGKLMH